MLLADGGSMQVAECPRPSLSFSEVVPPPTLMKPSEPPKTFYDMTRAELKQLLTGRVQHGSYNISPNYIRTELARRDADDAAQPAPPTGPLRIAIASTIAAVVSALAAVLSLTFSHAATDSPHSPPRGVCDCYYIDC
jgi:hypothetical protein